MAGTDEGKEVINMLGLIKEAPLLEEIAEDVGMPELEAARGNVALLFRRIVGHLNSDAFFANEDNGLAFIMAARDKLRVALQITEEDPEDDVKVEGTEEENNGIPLRDPLREFPEMPVLNVAARDPVQAISRIRELKINGTIGKPNQKGKLTYSSLMSQIKNAIRRKFEDSDICAAVRAQASHEHLKNYLLVLELGILVTQLLASICITVLYPHIHIPSCTHPSTQPVL